MALCSFILMYTRHIRVRFGGKVELRCSGNYFELCCTHTYAHTSMAFCLVFDFSNYIVVSYFLEFLCSALLSHGNELLSACYIVGNIVQNSKDLQNVTTILQS